MRTTQISFCLTLEGDLQIFSWCIQVTIDIKCCYSRVVFRYFFCRCYNLGYNINPLGMSNRLCTFPVPLTTPNLSSYIRWDHSVSWRIPQPEEFLSGQSGRQTEAIFEVDISTEGKDHYILDHFIDGRALFPAAGYLVLGWKMLAKSKGMVYTDMPVLFKNVSIHRATVLPSTGMEERF